MAHNECQELARTLPPGTTGKLSGYLTVTVGDVLFHRKPLRHAKIYISWWGEKEYLCMRSLTPNTSSGESVVKVRAQYEIRTSFYQFEKYLKVCESVKIRIVDEDNSKNIGFITLLDLWLMLNYCPYKSYFPISDASHQRIGEIYVEFKVFFLEKKTKSLESPYSVRKFFSEDEFSIVNKDIISQPTKQGSFTSENNKYCMKLDSDRLHPLDSHSNKCSLRNVLEKNTGKEHCIDSGFRSLSIVSGARSINNFQEDTDSQEYIMDYILGKRMNEIEETKAMNCLKDWPALESVLEVLGGSSEFIKKSSNSTKAEKTSECRKISLKDQLLSVHKVHRLPSMGFQIYLKIISIELACLNESKVYKSISTCPISGDTYFIEYRFPSSNPRESKIRPWKEPPQGVRMSSKKQVGSVVFFNQSSIHCLSTKYQEMEDQLATTIKFQIHSRHLNQRVSSPIGEAQILLGDLLPNDEQTSDVRKIPILTNQPHNRKSKGMLVLRVKWVNIARKLESEPEDISCKNEKTLEKLAFDDGCPKSSQQTNLPIKDTYMNQEMTVPYAKVPLLHVLLHVSEAYYCLTNTDSLKVCKKTSFNIYLVCRAFWNKKNSPRSPVLWNTNNPKFEFSEMEPLMLTPNFINMCQSNYLVVELWHKRSEIGEDELLGIAKVPLHQFYISYKDPTLLGEVMKLKYPVVSMDGNVKLYNPIDPSKICGWVHVLLALGTQDQIYSLRQSCLINKHPHNKRNEKRNTNPSPNYLSVFESSNTGSEKYSHKLVLNPSVKYVQIDSIKGFELSKEISLKNYDCYVEYRLPNNQNPLKTSLKPLSSVMNFSSSPVILKSPANTAEEIKFFVWCRCYDSDTLPRDRMVATAKLSLHRLFLKENDSLNKTWMQTFSLPLLLVEPNDYICSSSAFLVLKVSDKIESNVESCEIESMKSTADTEIISSPENISKKQNQETQTNVPHDNFPESRPVANRKTKTRPKNKGESQEIENLIEHKAQKRKEIYDDISALTKHQDTSKVSGNEKININSLATTVVVNEKVNASPVLDRLVTRTSTKVSNNKSKSKVTDLFKVHIEIEKAVHLKCDLLISGAYVTFWSYNKIQLWITSNVNSGDHPKWNWHCDTYLSGDLLTKSSNKLVLQIWTTKDINAEPNPSEDINLGQAAIDLSILVYGIPQVSGWFNILNSKNCCNGQIKVTVTPIEDLSRFKQIAIKNWLSEYFKYNEQLVSPILSAEVTDFQILKSNGDKEMVSQKEELLKEQHNSSLSEDKNAKHSASFTLKSKMDELDEMMKKWRDNFDFKGEDHSSYNATAEVNVTKIHNTHSESLDSFGGTSASISSSISQKLSNVNPSTELKILEKYVSDLVQNIQNSDNPSCVSPDLEELFYRCGGLELLDDREIEYQSNENHQHSDHAKAKYLGQEDSQHYNSKEASEEETETKDVIENCIVMNESSVTIPINKSSNCSSDENEYSSDFNSTFEDRSGEHPQEKQSVSCIEELKTSTMEDNINAQVEVIDLPRQAPEGGNPMEDEVLQANLTSMQMAPNTTTDEQKQDKNCYEETSLSALDTVFGDEELQRIAKIFNTKFTET